eukprot:TRINITY_DN22676_c0_g1_i1.p1 TRINITY_DN22676_c0_g1~~TRINITY_DN22676_c0_g1_i1.p1  ORF type:complete len:918 (+),score=107.28 TRINITY_DN22676_c0_g1_i1:91-2754(+)
MWPPGPPESPDHDGCGTDRAGADSLSSPGIRVRGSARTALRRCPGRRERCALCCLSLAAAYAVYLCVVLHALWQTRALVRRGWELAGLSDLSVGLHPGLCDLREVSVTAPFLRELPWVVRGDLISVVVTQEWDDAAGPETLRLVRLVTDPEPRLQMGSGDVMELLWESAFRGPGKLHIEVMGTLRVPLLPDLFFWFDAKWRIEERPTTRPDGGGAGGGGDSAVASGSWLDSFSVTESPAPHTPGSVSLSAALPFKEITYGDHTSEGSWEVDLGVKVFGPRYGWEDFGGFNLSRASLSVRGTALNLTAGWDWGANGDTIRALRNVSADARLGVVAVHAPGSVCPTQPSALLHRDLRLPRWDGWNSSLLFDASDPEGATGSISARTAAAESSAHGCHRSLHRFAVVDSVELRLPPWVPDHDDDRLPFIVHLQRSCPTALAPRGRIALEGGTLRLLVDGAHLANITVSSVVQEWGNEAGEPSTVAVTFTAPPAGSPERADFNRLVLDAVLSNGAAPWRWDIVAMPGQEGLLSLLKAAVVGSAEIDLLGRSLLAFVDSDYLPSSIAIKGDWWQAGVLQLGISEHLDAGFFRVFLAVDIPVELTELRGMAVPADGGGPRVSLEAAVSTGWNPGLELVARLLRFHGDVAVGGQSAGLLLGGGLGLNFSGRAGNFPYELRYAIGGPGAAVLGMARCAAQGVGGGLCNISCAFSARSPFGFALHLRPRDTLAAAMAYDQQSSRGWNAAGFEAELAALAADPAGPPCSLAAQAPWLPQGSVALVSSALCSTPGGPLLLVPGEAPLALSASSSAALPCPPTGAPEAALHVAGLWAEARGFSLPVSGLVRPPLPQRTPHPPLPPPPPPPPPPPLPHPFTTTASPEASPPPPSATFRSL